MTIQYLRPTFGAVLIFGASLSSNVSAQNNQPTVGTTTTPDTESLWLPPHGVDVPMYYSSGGSYTERPVVEAMVNGHGPYRFLVETGMASSYILSDVAKDAGLKTDVNGKVIADSIGIGSARLRHFEMDVHPDSKDDGTDGLLGLDAYRDLLLTLDFPHHRIRLEHGALPVANGRDVAAIYPVVGQLIGFDIQVAGKRVSALLDTQFDAAFAVPPNMADSALFAKPPIAIGAVSGPSVGNHTMLAGRLQDGIRVGDATFDRPLVVVTQGLPQLWFVGARALREFVVTLDQRHSLVRLAKSGQMHVAAPPSFRVSGWSTSRQDGKNVVDNVIPGGEAERQGVKVGDVLVSINGRPETSIHGAEWLALSHGAKPFQIVVRRGTETKQFTLTPHILIP